VRDSLAPRLGQIERSLRILRLQEVWLRHVKTALETKVDRKAVSVVTVKSHGRSELRLGARYQEQFFSGGKTKAPTLPSLVPGRRVFNLPAKGQLRAKWKWPEFALVGLRSGRRANVVHASDPVSAQGPVS